jgi:hypothetical protein
LLSKVEGFPLIKLAKKLKEATQSRHLRIQTSLFPLIKLAKKLKDVGKNYG